MRVAPPYIGCAAKVSIPQADSFGMNSTQSNKLNSHLAVQAVLNGTEVWQTLPAFAAGVEELEEHIASIQALAQTQTSQSGAAAEKAQAFQVLVDAAFETAAATRACAAASSNRDLARRVDYSRSNVGKGRDTEVVARCQDILAAATENLASLADYGITQAKLTALKKKIEGFQALQPKPRQGRAHSSSATKEIAKLFKQVDELLNDRLDGLAFQFKDTQAAFYNAYTTARSIVTASGGRSAKSTTVTPIAKAA